MAKPSRKLYWKDALRQAQADLASPQAVVWLGIETSEAIGQGQPGETPAQSDCKTDGPAKSRAVLPALILAAALLIPTAMNYLRAYRHINNVISNIP
jgi:hypothetical protein